MLLYGAYFLMRALPGFEKTRAGNPHARPQKRIAALIPARNEEMVIAYLVDSLMKQDYPKALYDVYVLVNNCTDDTRARAEQAGAIIMECDQPTTSKGEVLNHAFNRLMADDANDYDAFCVFDADNLVDVNFMQAANNALCNGYDIAQAYRDSKNPKENWISGCTATFFWFMSRLYNGSRANRGVTASLNGTGIVFSAQLIKKLGYDVDTLTEDQEYTAQCVLAGYKIGWMNDAIIYDEQPTSFKDSFVQRRRWGAGTMQCSRKYLGPLMKKAIKEKNRDCLDVGILFMGAYVQLIGCIPVVLTMITYIVRLQVNLISGAYFALGSMGLTALLSVLGGALFTGIVALIEKKTQKLTLSTYLLMWLYLLSWAPANLLCFVTRPPKWKSIAHTDARSIQDCEAENDGTRKVAARLRQSKRTSVRS
ncbi:glycosyltransferase family 2 protein [Eubacteriales bacterium OttesenSCG-928-N13]|nr:glycosyltransferase family 2 protein [Eubacteriales bacterium OttesenSCG-928-N13]